MDTKRRGRGCMIVRPCGCTLLDGHLYTRCATHEAEGGNLKPNAEQDAWLRRQMERA